MAIDPNIDLMARTMVAENASGSPEEYEAIANVMRNRLQGGQFGKDMESVIHGRTARGGWEFTPWSNPNAKNYPTKIDPNSPAYQSAYKIASDRMNGNAGDPTDGAIYYYSPRGMPKGAPPPSFAKGQEGQQIGAHKFYGPLAAKDEHPDLMKGAPEDVKQAPAESASIGDSPVSGGDRHADLMEGAPEPAKTPEQHSSVNPEEKGDFSGLFGELGPQIRAHPYIAGGLAALATRGVGRPVAVGLGSLIRAYPLASQILASSAAAGAAQMGIPQQAVHSLFDLLHMSGE